MQNLWPRLQNIVPAKNTTKCNRNFKKVDSIGEHFFNIGYLSDSPDDWYAVDLYTTRFGKREPIHASWVNYVRPSNNEQSGVEVVHSNGDITQFNPTRKLQNELLSDSKYLGNKCAIVVGSSTAFVNAETGKLKGLQGIGALETGWMGITYDKKRNNLILAGANQTIVIYSLDTKMLISEFPAVIVPSARYQFAECVRLVAGDDWIGVLNIPQQRINFYSYSQDPKISSHFLEQWDLKNDYLWVHDIAANGSLLSLGTADGQLVILEPDFNSCK